MNKKKIINDPVYGFINIPNELVYDVINHPYLQRLRRIRQLGLTDFVYPGALHTRFHHAIGAMHLMKETLDNLREKQIVINDEEYTASLLAILLHDVGHAPFSHALEHILVHGAAHEDLSSLIMERLNEEYNGKLNLCLKIFKNQYHRKFFNQLVSSQLDIDRLDYLNRDSFFTGVSEGKISAHRIIKMLNVHNDELVVEEKAIYSIENFLSARRLMYWQVYLHKTTIGVEQMVVQTILRLRELIRSGKFNLPDVLQIFLEKDLNLQDLKEKPDLLNAYLCLDDYNVMWAIKQGNRSEDKVLKMLSGMLLNRNLFKVYLSENPVTNEEMKGALSNVKDKYFLTDEEAEYFVLQGERTNAAYIGGGQRIKIISKSGDIHDIEEAADLPNIKAMRKIVKKFYLCMPKTISL
ncbi:MAG: HD domain-containing protein [Cyclobacteriaceae bacterium]|nr:HD domain-containing protein [Cyclobacteriaceae bacterium]